MNFYNIIKHNQSWNTRYVCVCVDNNLFFFFNNTLKVILAFFIVHRMSNCLKTQIATTNGLRSFGSYPIKLMHDLKTATSVRSFTPNLLSKLQKPRD